MIKSILLSVDGSSYTEAVVDAGVFLAKKLNAKLQILSVLDVRPYDWQAVIGSESIVPIVPTPTPSEEGQEQKKEEIEKMLREIEQKLTDKNVEYCVHSATGIPSDCICDYSRVADLVILGTRGEFRVWHSDVIGATLAPVSRQLEKPFLVVGEKFKASHRYVVAYDGSATASKALNLAGYLGSALGIEGTVLVVSAREDKSAELIKEAHEYLKNYDINCECVVASGTPAKVIVDFAKDNKCDLIIMGAYGQSRFHEVVWGSTTEEVLKSVEIPVLLAK